MVNLDVIFVFTYIPLKKTINICTNTQFENTERVESFIENKIWGTFVSCNKRILFF